MGIRDTSYYNWQIIRKKIENDQRTFQYTGIFVDMSGNYYLCGTKYLAGNVNKNCWFVERSIDRGQTWTELNVFTGTFTQNYAAGSETVFYNSPEKIIVNRNDPNHILVAGHERSGTFNMRGYVRISTDFGVTWQTAVQITGGFRDIAQRPSDGKYFVCGQSGTFNKFYYYTMSSSDGTANSFVPLDQLFHFTGSVVSSSIARAVWFSASSVYTCGAVTAGNGSAWGLIRSGSTGHSASFGNIHSYSFNSEPIGTGFLWGFAHEASGTIYAGDQSFVGFGQNTGRMWMQQTRAPNSFTTVQEAFDEGDGGEGQGDGTIGTGDVWSAVPAFAENNIYWLSRKLNFFFGNYAPTILAKLPLATFSKSMKSIKFEKPGGAFYSKLVPTGRTYFGGEDPGSGGNKVFYNEPTQEVFFTVTTVDGAIGLVRGKLTANSASLSPFTLNTSIGFSKYEAYGVPESGFALTNVAEYPHAGGLFQMKNMVLGTQTSGKVGKGEDSIVQIKHIGSTVKIMWPRQENGDSTLVGYGDLSLGQSIGKLSTNLEPGDFIDVTEFDHMSLYCYLQKRASGTLDDIMIEVERKPIRDIGFATDQTVSYSISGSITEARLRDLYYVKAIDYGDLSIREVAWPVDIPLTNTKQVRISAKFKNGQAADVNKNFIVYGRFIKSSKDTNET